VIIVLVGGGRRGDVVAVAVAVVATVTILLLLTYLLHGAESFLRS